MSHEEQIFEWWCEEAKEREIIFEYYKQIPELDVYGMHFDLIPKYAYDEPWIECGNHLIHHKKLTIGPWTYTPDFLILFHADSRLNQYFIPSQNDLYARILPVYIDTKGTRETSDQTRLFKLKQLMMWHMYKIYINRIRVKYFCQHIWTPRKAIEMPDRSKYITVSKARSIEEFIHDNR